MVLGAALAATLALAAVGAPFAHAQAPTKIARIAWLSPAGSTTGASALDALRAGLQELGYVEGRNITIENGKRLELLKEAAPKLRRVALIYNPDNRAQVLALEETQHWAKTLGVTIEPHRVRGAGDFAGVFDAVAKHRPDALMTTADVFIASHRARVVEFAARHRLLSMYPGKEYLEVGGLMFYGGSIPDMYRRAAIYVDRILKGAKPADLPVEQPTKFDLVINMKTAKALGLAIPQSLLLHADEIIQ